MMLPLLLAAPILGGTPTTVGQFPTVVAIKVGQGLCTGTLVSSKMIMTAGHCITPDIVGVPDDEALVASIEVYFDTLSIGMTGTPHKAKRVIHAGFDETVVGIHDIGLIELDTLVTDRLPSHVNFYAAAAPAIGTVGTMVGYGQTSSGSAGVEYYLEERTSVSCPTAVPASLGVDAKDENLLCFAQTDGKGKCHGDSGGPTFMMQGGVPVVVGVTSFGDGACEIVGADTRTDAESTFLIANVPDICVGSEPCGRDDGGGCSTSGGAGLAIAAALAGLRRRKR